MLKRIVFILMAAFALSAASCYVGVGHSRADELRIDRHGVRVEEHERHEQHRNFDRNEFRHREFDRHNFHARIFVGTPAFWPDEEITFIGDDGRYAYYCPNPVGYYPDVEFCPRGWFKVIVR